MITRKGVAGRGPRQEIKGVTNKNAAKFERPRERGIVRGEDVKLDLRNRDWGKKGKKKRKKGGR